MDACTRVDASSSEYLQIYQSSRQFHDRHTVTLRAPHTGAGLATPGAQAICLASVPVADGVAGLDAGAEPTTVDHSDRHRCSIAFVPCCPDTLPTDWFPGLTHDEYPASGLGISGRPP
jgi:hypothetical protein